LLVSLLLRTMAKPKRSLLFSLLFVGLVVTAITGTGAWFLLGDSIRERWNRERFDSAAWQSESSRSSTNAVRIRMVDDLLSRHNFRGMTREQTVAIVGEPDMTEYFRDWDMVYWLGPERGLLSIDSEWLVFRLDGQKKVTDYKNEAGQRCAASIRRDWGIAQKNFASGERFAVSEPGMPGSTRATLQPAWCRGCNRFARPCGPAACGDIPFAAFQLAHVWRSADSSSSRFLNSSSAGIAGRP
jgi:hypothetical protein